jgi:hypothetical protein
MKKIMVVAVSVLMSTFAFAKGADEPTPASSVAVMSSGSNLFKVFYKSGKSNNVSLSIRNENNEIVFSEKLKKTDGFMRPYNFQNLPEGQYTIEVQDENGIQTEKINYGIVKIEKTVNITNVPSEDGRYLLTGFSRGADKITIRIYDAEGKTTYDETLQVDGEFAQLYNLKSLSRAFTIEVSDASGVLKNFDR